MMVKNLLMAKSSPSFNKLSTDSVPKMMNVWRGKKKASALTSLDFSRKAAVASRQGRNPTGQRVGFLAIKRRAFKEVSLASALNCVEIIKRVMVDQAEASLKDSPAFSTNSKICREENIYAVFGNITPFIPWHLSLIRGMHSFYSKLILSKILTLLRHILISQPHMYL